jgi:hypothetical protein
MRLTSREARTTGMAGMLRTFVGDLEHRRLERSLQRLPDAVISGRRNHRHLGTIVVLPIMVNGAH